jgi:hypothetical protein
LNNAPYFAYLMQLRLGVSPSAEIKKGIINESPLIFQCFLRLL